MGDLEELLLCALDQAAQILEQRKHVCTREVSRKHTVPAIHRPLPLILRAVHKRSKANTSVRKGGVKETIDHAIHPRLSLFLVWCYGSAHHRAGKEHDCARECKIQHVGEAGRAQQQPRALVMLLQDLCHGSVVKQAPVHEHHARAMELWVHVRQCV
eukprot:1141119-Pelagomonas_calceolata.AAC.2